MIKIKRDDAFVDYFRAYKIVLDDNVIGKIKYDQEVELNVPAGRHQLYLKIDWCRSNIVDFESNGEVIEFECGSNLRGLKIILAVLYATFLYNRYIRLKKK